MKIAILNIYQCEVARGAETFVSELSDRLSFRHNVDVFTEKKKPMRRWPIIWRLFLDPPGIAIALFTLKQLPKIWKNKYEIVIPLNGGWQPALLRLITWLYGGKMVISGQSGIGWDDRFNLWSFPDVFVALSSKAKSWAGKVNPYIKKIVYIPNGVDLLKFSQEGSKYPVNIKEPIVLCVGALSATKRIDLVIQAVSILKDVSLVVVGEGELKVEIEKLGHKLLRERFKLIHLKHKDMPKIYRLANLFTLAPDVSEAFGIVYLEALSSGLPVVAIDDDIRREIIGDAGIFVDPINIKHYANAINDALNRYWGNKPREQAEKFGWHEIANKYETVFSDLIR